jgi:hypothetical protein
MVEEAGISLLKLTCQVGGERMSIYYKYRKTVRKRANADRF